MKQIADLIPEPGNAVLSTDSRSSLPGNWVKALFAKFQVRYGHKWTSNFQDDKTLEIAVQEWGEGLHGLTGDQIRSGIDAWKGDWPPSLAEFEKACRGNLDESGGDKHYCRTNAAAYRERDKSRLLSNDDRDKRRAGYREGLKKLKEAMGG